MLTRMRWRLIAASMPSGVEHNEAQKMPQRVYVLIAASMPSGVEHPKSAQVRALERATDRRLDAFGR